MYAIALAFDEKVKCNWGPSQGTGWGANIVLCHFVITPFVTSLHFQKGFF